MSAEIALAEGFTLRARLGTYDSEVWCTRKDGRSLLASMLITAVRDEGGEASANLRFAGPETMETKIFGRLSAWQNWIFQRPNAVGEKGALKVYGKGGKAQFDFERV